MNTFGVRGLLARHIASYAYSWFPLFDPSGNAATLVRSNGTAGGDYAAYDGFGARTSTGTYTASDPFAGYGGQLGYYSDWETGLTLCGHRYYDSANGRWLTKDPIGTAGGVNVYAYCGNNGVSRNDPSGLKPQELSLLNTIRVLMCLQMGFCNFPGGNSLQPEDPKGAPQTPITEICEHPSPKKPKIPITGPDPDGDLEPTPFQRWLANVSDADYVWGVVGITVGTILVIEGVAYLVVAGGRLVATGASGAAASGSAGGLATAM